MERSIVQIKLGCVAGRSNFDWDLQALSLQNVMIIDIPTTPHYSYMAGGLLINSNIVLCWYNTSPQLDNQKDVITEPI